MEITLREASLLVGKTVRALRGQIRRGELPGVQRGRQWYVERKDLPLTEAQRVALQARSDTIRSAVDAALPSRVARTTDRAARSLVDLDAFRITAQVLLDIRRRSDAPGATEAAEHLVAACGALAEGTFVYDRPRKLAALSDARALVGRAVASLFLAAGIPPAEPAATWIATLERDVTPAVSGYARWVASLPGGR